MTVVLSNFFLSIYIDRAALKFGFQALFPNVLVLITFYYCIDICFSQFLCNIFITFVISYSLSYDCSEKINFCCLNLF
jgi:hypothetical protein